MIKRAVVAPTSTPNVVPPDTLPATGGHDAPTVLAGFAVLLAGGLLVWLTRRRATP